LGALVGVGLLVSAGIFIGRNVAYQYGDNRYSMLERRGLLDDLRQRMYNRFLLPGRESIRPGMMGRNNTRQGIQGLFRNDTYTGAPLTIESAKTAVESYLTSLNNEDLYLKEIMVFNENAYAVIAETSTGKGAMELLVNPAKSSVIPEIGPNRMWNTKYGHMMNSNCGQNQQGICANNQLSTAVITENSVSAEQALQYGQEYLDENITGASVADDATEFYGYYSMDYLIDGKPAGMLSVNGFTGQVWLHTWHGTFIEEWEAQ